MKREIDWHRYCLECSVHNEKIKRSNVKKALMELENLKRKNKIRQAQIDLSVKENKKSFDHEVYAIKRKGWLDNIS